MCHACGLPQDFCRSATVRFLTLQVIWTKTVGYVDDCHVVVGTPDCLAEVLQDPNAQEVLQHTKACSYRLCASQQLLLLDRTTLLFVYCACLPLEDDTCSSLDPGLGKRQQAASKDDYNFQSRTPCSASWNVVQFSGFRSGSFPPDAPPTPCSTVKTAPLFLF